MALGRPRKSSGGHVHRTPDAGLRCRSRCATLVGSARCCTPGRHQRLNGHVTIDRCRCMQRAALAQITTRNGACLSARLEINERYMCHAADHSLRFLRCYLHSPSLFSPSCHAVFCCETKMSCSVHHLDKRLCACRFSYRFTAEAAFRLLSLG